MVSGGIKNNKNFDGFIRAFWRRIYPYRNDYSSELPNELPQPFRCHMMTALMALDHEDDENCENKYHWFCFSFMGKSNGKDAHASVYQSQKDKNITVDLIDKAMGGSRLDSGVLISVSYLGFMDKDSFAGDVEVNTVAG